MFRCIIYSCVLLCFLCSVTFCCVLLRFVVVLCFCVLFSCSCVEFFAFFFSVLSVWLCSILFRFVVFCYYAVLLRFVLLCLFCTNGYHPTASVTDMIRELGWQTLEQRRSFFRLTLLYNMSHGLLDIDVDYRPILVDIMNLELTATTILNIPNIERRKTRTFIRIFRGP